MQNSYSIRARLEQEEHDLTCIMTSHCKGKTLQDFQARQEFYNARERERQEMMKTKSFWPLLKN